MLLMCLFTEGIGIYQNLTVLFLFNLFVLFISSPSLQLVYWNWRDKAGVTTFYFSRFPEGMMEKDMWRIFQKWGKVWEVFIPRTKNKLGHRFGFVRFKEVVDVQRLERQLDNNIFLGGVKLLVNRPKFDRGKVVGIREKGFSSYGDGDCAGKLYIHTPSLSVEEVSKLMLGCRNL